MPAAIRWPPFTSSGFRDLRDFYAAWNRDLLGAFRLCQERGQLEIITCAATHALLPLLGNHPPSLRAQILTARDHHRQWFGVDPRGIWLPECAYAEGVEQVLQEANIRWFILDTHGVLHATPRPSYGVFAPLFTPNGVAAFGRDLESAKQVWSRQEGYPAIPVTAISTAISGSTSTSITWPLPPLAGSSRFHRIKYHAISGNNHAKQLYDRAAALRAADEHAGHFLHARVDQIRQLAGFMDRPPLIVAPYDAELFGHWWYEGPEFLDWLVRKACYDQQQFSLITPENYLQQHPTQQVARPSASSWGEEGYWRAWLNESNEWIYPHLQIAQERMTELARHNPRARPAPRTRPQPGRPRTHARPSQRLALHPPHRHQSRIRPPPGQGPPASLHRPP
jgi:1,4-alpha-glucan branching enzyme